MTAGAGQTVVITGGNTGLGLACASAILRSPGESRFHIVLACRDRRRAQVAVDELSRATDAAGQAEAMSLDLASLTSVRAFAGELNTRLRAATMPPLQAVVCNAGIQSATTQTVTTDGFESTFGVNHLGHFALINELLPMVSPPARVVVVTSGTHDPAQKWGVPAPAWNDTASLARGELGAAATSDRPFAASQRRYSTSKLANIYFTYALARRLPAGATANAFDPGLMPGTGLVRDTPAGYRFIANRVAPHMLWLMRRVLGPNVHTVEESGEALARLVIDPELAGTTGKYFEGSRQISSSDESYDGVRADDLWNGSLALVESVFDGPRNDSGG